MQRLRRRQGLTCHEKREASPHGLAISRARKPGKEAEVVSDLRYRREHCGRPQLSNPATDPRRRILPHFHTDVGFYMAPRDATAFYGSLWTEDGTFFLGPQRGATILVLPDREVLQVLRRGVAKGWEEKSLDWCFSYRDDASGLIGLDGDLNLVDALFQRLVLLLGIVQLVAELST